MGRSQQRNENTQRAAITQGNNPRPKPTRHAACVQSPSLQVKYAQVEWVSERARACMYANVYVCACACACMCVRACMCANVYVYACACMSMRACVRRQTRGVVTYEWRETCGARKLERGNDTVVGLDHLLIESNRVVVLMRTRM